MTAACESECMPERRALVRYFYTINVFMYNDLGPSAGSRTETCPESKLTLYIFEGLAVGSVGLVDLGVAYADVQARIVLDAQQPCPRALGPPDA